MPKYISIYMNSGRLEEVFFFRIPDKEITSHYKIWSLSCYHISKFPAFS